MNYHLEFVRSSEKEHAKIPPPFYQEILDEIIHLSEDATPPGSKKLKGHKKLWRIKIGKYRVVYELDETKKNVCIIRIRHRKDIYQSL